MTDIADEIVDKKEDPGNNPKGVPKLLILNAEGNEGPDIAALKRLFEITLETRNFEINQLVQRNNFFMIFQGVLLAGLIQSSHLKPVVSFLVCLAGLIISIFQIQMASGAKFWQEYWEAALHSIEKELIRHLATPEAGRYKLFHLFHDEEHLYRDMVKKRLNGKGFGITRNLVMKQYSVSRAPIYVAITFSIIWGLLLICTMEAYSSFSVPSFIKGF